MSNITDANIKYLGDFKLWLDDFELRHYILEVKMISAERARELTTSKDHIKYDKLSSLIYQATQKGKSCIKYYSWFGYLDLKVMEKLHNYGYIIYLNGQCANNCTSIVVPNNIFDVYVIHW